MSLKISSFLCIQLIDGEKFKSNDVFELSFVNVLLGVTK